MEYNTKSCLGPSEEDLPTLMLIQQAWLDDNPQVYTDYDGSTQGLPSTEEVEWVLRRMDQVEQLMNLRGPVDLAYCEGGNTCNWTNAELARYEEWCGGDNDNTHDPMGDMMGRNA